MIRIKIKFLFFCSIYFSQGIMNSYGVGHFHKNQGVNNAVDGITDLSPSIMHGVSLGNPSSWHNLKFTYLSISYSGNDNKSKKLSNYNGQSSLSNAIWIVPIKSKSSFGISLSPYSDQKISLVGSETSKFYAFDDTLVISKSLDRFGGIMSFSIGTSFLLNDIISLGAKMQLLFGSSRQNQTIFFDGSGIIKQSREKYNGILNNLFLSLNLTESLRIYTSTLFALKPLSAVITEKHLFDYANGNGYHDLNLISDFPHPDSVESVAGFGKDNIHSPFEYKIEVNKLIGESSAIAFQIYRNQENAKNIGVVQYPIDSWIKSANSIKMSLIKYSNSLSLKLIDKFSFRSGLKYSDYILNNNGSNINEIGFLVGLGFKFGLVGNQLDINYYIGNRKYPNLSDEESIHQIQFGLSLADIWFVKRRQK